MQPLTADMILNAWERGARLHPIDQALLVLHLSCPERPRDALADLGLGTRDRLLLDLYRQTFGDGLEAYTECPACREPLEFSLSCDRFLAAATGRAMPPRSVTIEGNVFSVRAPNSRDAAAAAGCEDLVAAKNELLARCATPAAGSTSIGALPEQARSALGAEIATLDPDAEMLLDLTCPACAHEWQGMFDIIAFLWSEIRGRARRLLQEVDLLARVYGWSEADILALSNERRALYVDMAAA